MHLVSRLVALSILLSGGLPPVLAGGALDADVLFVQINDERDDCEVPLAGFCSFDVSSDGTAGNSVLDVYQEIHYVGIATDIPLLPDHSLIIRGNDVYAPNPIVPAATETWNAFKPNDHPGSDHAWVELTPHHAGIFYHGPWLGNLTGPWRDNGLGTEWGKDYHQIGPYNAPGGRGRTDNLSSGSGDVCDISGFTTECHQLEEDVDSTWEATTPDIQIGYQFWDIQAATNRSMLTPPEAHLVKQDNPPTWWKDAYASWSRHARRPSSWPDLPPPSSLALPEPGSRFYEGRTQPTTPRTERIQQEDVSGPPEGPPLAAVVAAASAGAALLLLAIALYSRIARAHVLANPTRRAVYELIQASPGIGVTQILEKVDVSRNAVEHHLDHLKKHALLTERRAGHARSFFAADACPGNDALECLAVLRHDTRRRLAGALLQGASTQRDIETQTGVPQRLVAHHLARLEKARLVTSSGSRPKRYAVTPQLQHALDAALGTPPCKKPSPHGTTAGKGTGRPASLQ